MKLQIKVNGVEELRRKFANVAEVAVSGTMTRRGLTDAARIVTRAQKNLAPVRPKGTKRFRSIGKVKTGVGYVRPDGPLRYIPPGLVKRSIGFRVIKPKGKDAQFMVKMGMNVGKKRSNKNFAPHAAFVGVGTQPRFSNGRLRGNEYGPSRVSRGRMPQNRFINDGTQFAAASAIAALDKAVKEDMVRAYKLSLRASRVVQ